MIRIYIKNKSRDGVVRSEFGVGVITRRPEGLEQHELGTTPEKRQISLSLLYGPWRGDVQLDAGCQSSTASVGGWVRRAQEQPHWLGYGSTMRILEAGLRLQSES